MEVTHHFGTIACAFSQKPCKLPPELIPRPSPVQALWRAINVISFD
ncbi:MAG: hypothetical protein KGD70_14120 [Candidatus Lokiarchaeota archaeon]|nr:hypothetical protein [Candidatus Lokiarchaeota archaeon]